MKDFFSILRRFVPPYKYYLALNIFFNILASVLTLFSFALIIPILEILFKLKQASYTFMEWGSGSIKDVVINNFYYYITTIIDEKGAGFALLILGVFLMVMTFFKTAATYLSSYFMIPLRSGIVRDIRNYVYEKVVSLPIGFFTSEKKGDVMARMSGDVGEIENSIMASLDMMFKNPIMIIVCLATMFAISWQLTLFVLILLPTAGYIMGQVGKKLKRRSLEGQNQWGLLMSIIEETLGGLRIVKAFNAEDKMIKWFHDDNNRFYRISNRINRRQSLAHPMSEFLGTCTICIVLWYGGSLILSGTRSIDAASFIYYLVIFYSIINPAKDLSKAAYSIQKGLASMVRVDLILSAVNPIQDPKNPVELKEMKEGIEYRGVSFRYSTENVVKHVDLSIKKGQTVALVGQSGSGKSTVARCLVNIYQPAQGEIWYKDVNICDKKEFRKNKKMLQTRRQMIFQDSASSLNQKMKVSDIITEPMRIQHITPPRGSYVKEAAFQMEYVGLENSFLERYPSELSGGQRQRVAIARSLCMEPEFLVADEPIASLDVSIQAQIVNLFRHLQEEHGFTFLFIAHDLAMVEYLCDRVGVMYHGKLVELAPSEELYSNPVHPYTKTLLSAIPVPDPIRERKRVLQYYDGEGMENSVWTEVSPEHFAMLPADGKGCSI